MCRCQAAPTLATAVPDSLGRLWGWMSGNDTSCAYKDSNGGALTFVSLTASPVPTAPTDTSIQTNNNAPATSNSTPTTGTLGDPKRTPSIRILAEGTDTLITSPAAATRTLSQVEDAPPAATSLTKEPTDDDLQLLLSMYPSNAPSGPVTTDGASLTAFQPQVQILDAASLQRAASTAAAQQAALGLDPQTAAEGARTSALAALNASILATAAAAVVEDGPPVNVSITVDSSAVTSPGSPHVTLPGGGPHPTSVIINGKLAIADSRATGTRRSLASRAAEALKALLSAATRTDAVTAPQPPRLGHQHARRELLLQQQRQRPTTLVLTKAAGATVAAAAPDERQLRSGPQQSGHSHHHQQHKNHRSKVHLAHGHYSAEAAANLDRPVPARSAAEVPAAVMQRYPEHIVAEAALAATAGNLGQDPHGSITHPVHPIDSFYRRTVLAASPTVAHESVSWDAQLTRRRLLGDSDFPSCRNYPAPASVVQDGAGRWVRRFAGESLDTYWLLPEVRVTVCSQGCKSPQGQGGSQPTG